MPDRNVRRDVLKAVDKVKGDMSEDDVKRLNDSIQELTDDYVSQVYSSLMRVSRLWQPVSTLLSAASWSSCCGGF